MNKYEEKAIAELKIWQKRMARKPSLTSKLTKGVQRKINNIIPEKVHAVMTAAIKNMVQAVLAGSEYLSRDSQVTDKSLADREKLVWDKVEFYKKAAAVSGAGTGAGGIILGLADFPILLSLKMKFLFDAAACYGFDVRKFRERLYILEIFQLAFSSQERRLEVYHSILNWQDHHDEIPASMEEPDWRIFQQEYRDYIDLAKLLQLVPGIGAVVGAYANYKFMDKLGETAVNCYRLRLFKG